jgi:hypothetical protein
MNERNFVAPCTEDESRLSRAVRVYHDPATAITPARDQMQLPSPVETRQIVKTDARDRAVGFNISTAGLAAIVALGGTLITVAGWGVPILSVATLATFFALAAVVWAGAWFWYNAASPDGVGLIGVLLHYRLLRHEQRARLERIDAMMEDER